jgi:integrase
VPQETPLITVSKSRARNRRLEVGEAERIRKFAGPLILDFFTAMLETGCRPGELRTLQWAEVKGRLLRDSREHSEGPRGAQGSHPRRPA